MVERLIGRRWELGALLDLLGSARDGHGRGLLLLGDAGIGKTTLAEALAAEAAGCTIGWGRCPESDALPYWPWRQALLALGAAAPLAGSAASGRPSMFADVAELLARATADIPALLILEDVHLADPASLALLQFLAGMLPELRCSLVLTGRDNSVDLPAAAADVLEALPPVVGRLTLRGLDRSDTAVLVEQVLGRSDPDFADAVYERTDGNPFFASRLPGVEDKVMNTAWPAFRNSPLTALRDDLAGRLCPQPRLHTGAGEVALDLALGRGFAILSRGAGELEAFDPDTRRYFESLGTTVVRLGDVASGGVADTGGNLTELLDRAHADALLLRPDRVVAASADRADLRRWRRLLESAGIAAPEGISA